MNHVVHRGCRWNNHHHSNPTSNTSSAARIVGVFDPVSPDNPSPAMSRLLTFVLVVSTVDGSGAAPGGNFRSAFTTIRCAAEYLGWQDVSVSVAARAGS